MAVGHGGGDVPERLGHELLLQRTVIVALVKLRAKVVPFEVREDILHQERLLLRQQLWIGLAVIHNVKKRGRRGKQAVEDSSCRVEFCLDVSHVPVIAPPPSAVRYTTSGVLLPSD